MENPRQLQCKALRELEKSRRRKNNGKQWKKQCGKQSNRCPRAPASPGHVQTSQKQSPAAERRRAHISETRISAIAHATARCTQNNKALPLFPHGYGDEVGGIRGLHRRRDRKMGEAGRGRQHQDGLMPRATGRTCGKSRGLQFVRSPGGIPFDDPLLLVVDEQEEIEVAGGGITAGARLHAFAPSRVVGLEAPIRGREGLSPRTPLLLVIVGCAKRSVRTD